MASSADTIIRERIGREEAESDGLTFGFIGLPGYHPQWVYVVFFASTLVGGHKCRSQAPHPTTGQDQRRDVFEECLSALHCLGEIGLDQQ